MCSAFHPVCAFKCFNHDYANFIVHRSWKPISCVDVLEGNLTFCWENLMKFFFSIPFSYDRSVDAVCCVNICCVAFEMVLRCLKKLPDVSITVPFYFFARNVFLIIFILNGFWVGKTWPSFKAYLLPNSFLQLFTQQVL